MNIGFAYNKNFIYIYYLFFIIGIATVAILKPHFNWDMIGYVASALHFKYSNIEELHKVVYEGLKNNMNSKTFFELTDSGNVYRQTMATNPHLFAQQLPFYEIRPIYNGLIYILYKLGINIFSATYYISVASTIIAIVVILKTFLAKVDSVLLLLIPVALMSFGLLSLAEYSTPDALTFMALALFANFFVKSKENLILILLPILVLLRTDLVIFSILYLLYYLYLHKKHYAKIFLSGVISLFFYIAVNKIAGNYGWSTIFYFTLVHQINNPADLNLVVSLKDYVHAFAAGVYLALSDYRFLAYLLILSLNSILVVRFHKRLKEINIIRFFILIPLIYIIIHFLLFPVTWFRFFIGFYFFNFIATLLIVDNLIKNEN